MRHSVAVQTWQRGVGEAEEERGGVAGWRTGRQAVRHRARGGLAFPSSLPAGQQPTSLGRGSTRPQGQAAGQQAHLAGSPPLPAAPSGPGHRPAAHPHRRVPGLQYSPGTKVLPAPWWRRRPAALLRTKPLLVNQQRPRPATLLPALELLRRALAGAPAAPAAVAGAALPGEGAAGPAATPAAAAQQPAPAAAAAAAAAAGPQGSAPAGGGRGACPRLSGAAAVRRTAGRPPTWHLPALLRRPLGGGPAPAPAMGAGGVGCGRGQGQGLGHGPRLLPAPPPARRGGGGAADGRGSAAARAAVPLWRLRLRPGAWQGGRGQRWWQSSRGSRSG